MLYILICILLTTLLTVFFKEAQRHGISATRAITWNYAVCAAVGLTLSPEAVHIPFKSPWLFSIMVIVTGTLFASNFQLMNRNTRDAGLASTAVLSKMSMILPVLVSAIFYHERFNFLHLAGVLLALTAVVLINAGNPAHNKKGFALGLAGMLLFFTTGITDSLFKVFHEQFPMIQAWDFSVLSFGWAFFVSLPFALLSKEKSASQGKEITGGILLGLFNFFSLVAFFKAMAFFEGPVLYPVDHAGVLVLSSLGAGFLYREKFRLPNFIGLAAAGSAIALLMLA